jgi:hypothetical protein
MEAASALMHEPLISEYRQRPARFNAEGKKGSETICTSDDLAL